MEQILSSLCKRLRLGSGLVEHAKTIKKKNHMEFLIDLFTLEIENREMKRKNTYIKAAKFDFTLTSCIFNAIITNNIGFRARCKSSPVVKSILL